MLLISNGEKILSNVNVVVCGQVKNENCSLPVAVRVSKLRVLKLPNIWARQPRPQGPLSNSRQREDPGDEVVGTAQSDVKCSVNGYLNV